jgi:ribulose-phosphate 3-epimerase
VKVAGSLWSVSPAAQVSEAIRLERAGLNRLHWDYSDGIFAAPGGFSPERAIELATATSMSSEVHLMAGQTLQLVDAWTDLCDRIAIHFESEDWKNSMTRIEQRGSRPCIAISPQTPWNDVPDECDVLVMSIIPGAAGSAFDRASLVKVAELLSANASREIGLDGGVTRDLANDALHAGVAWLVVGTDLFRPGGSQSWRDLLS